jgi:AmiR/NasT family two-component response regulator
MKVTQGKQPIFWLVRLLGAIGLVMAVVMIGQTGLQLRIAGTRLVALTSPGRISTEELKLANIDTYLIKPVKQSRLFDSLASAGGELLSATALRNQMNLLLKPIRIR